MTLSKEKDYTETMAELRRHQELRAQSYRERALKLFPWVCARCGREFAGKKLQQLTVHHKDHNHDNNPADGSNWELLCVYCHDHEHTKQVNASFYGSPPPTDAEKPATTYSPFADLDQLLKKKQSH
ncbi:MAG: HNH nuclease family protein [Deltaproteobacteria bacterium]|nr:HNH nuclease family protein [Candidatus Anaeroferrophillus wilburensis]MBN2888043.1 HNH nuclease family protein [Deltaproteobacteria bacterium]